MLYLVNTKPVDPETEAVAARELAAVIRRYLQSHPNAADTKEGVARWWLSVQRHKDAVEAVDKALRILILEGVIREVPRVSGEPLFSLNA